ncbi:hypothetical protein DNTS_033078, partial [Danionella cerebrum]
SDSFSFATHCSDDIGWVSKLPPPSLQHHCATLHELQPDILNDYDITGLISQGGFGMVYEGRRLKDGLEVAVKVVTKTKTMQRMKIPGSPSPVPLEIVLLLMVNCPSAVPEIIKLLDWQDISDYYILILELPSLCEDLDFFLAHRGGSVNEAVARILMWQITYASQVCCSRRVFHRDIKLGNILINPRSLRIKLIDFGCGDILKDSPYFTYSGTRMYCPPEFWINGSYNAKPATVWSLGVLLFVILCGHFPDARDLMLIRLRIWRQKLLSPTCCELIHSLLQQNPQQRIALERILHHPWPFISHDKTWDGRTDRRFTNPG